MSVKTKAAKHPEGSIVWSRVITAAAVMVLIAWGLAKLAIAWNGTLARNEQIMRMNRLSAAHTVTQTARTRALEHYIGTWTVTQYDSNGASGTWMYSALLSAPGREDLRLESGNGSELEQAVKRMRKGSRVPLFFTDQPDYMPSESDTPETILYHEVPETDFVSVGTIVPPSASPR